MPSQGPNNGSTFANDTSIGSVVWTNPTYAQTSDDQRASAEVTDSAPSYYLKATGFGFTIPSGATINGILVEVERMADLAATMRDNSVRIVKGGLFAGSEKALAPYWPTADTYASYGGSTDLWGLAWTAADINATNFGMVISAIRDESAADFARIDHIRITVYYTATVTWSGGGTLTLAGSQSAVIKAKAAGTLSTAGSHIGKLKATYTGTLTTAGALSTRRILVVTLQGILVTLGHHLGIVKAPSAGTLSTAGALSGVVKARQAGTLTAAGALSNVVKAVLAGTLSTAGTVKNVFKIPLSGVLSTSGSLLNVVKTKLAGTLTTAGALFFKSIPWKGPRRHRAVITSTSDNVEGHIL